MRFPDDIFIGVFMVNVSLSVPRSLSDPHSVTAFSADESFEERVIFSAEGIRTATAGRCIWEHLLIPQQTCKFNPESIYELF